MEGNQNEWSEIDIDGLADRMLQFDLGGNDDDKFEPGMDEYHDRNFHRHEGVERAAYEKQVSRLLDLQQEVLNIMTRYEEYKAFR